MREIDSDLQLAVSIGDLNQIHRLVQNGADVNASSLTAGITALIIAAAQAPANVVRYLLENGAYADRAKKMYGETPLYVASLYNRLDVVQLLLRYGASVDLALVFDGTCDETTPLLAACELGYPGVVRCLVDHGANVNFVRANGSTALHLACGWDQAFIDHTVAAGRNEENFLNIIDILLAQGTNACAGNASGSTPLHLAITQGHLKIAEKLLQDPRSCECVEMINNKQQTPLWLACFHGHYTIVESLLKANPQCSINAPDHDGYTPLLASIDKGHSNIVSLLLEHGADPTLRRQTDGSTPLHVAAAQGRINMAALLIKHGGLDVTASRFTDGKTPLHIASSVGNLQMAGLMLAEGADQWKVEAYGLTPLDYACRRKDSNMTRLLLETGTSHIVGA